MLNTIYSWMFYNVILPRIEKYTYVVSLGGGLKRSSPRSSALDLERLLLQLKKESIVTYQTVRSRFQVNHWHQMIHGNSSRGRNIRKDISDLQDKQKSQKVILNKLGN